MENTTALKAIRLKCLDCCCGSQNEVKLCACEDCALYPFRYGKNPFRKKKTYSDEEILRMKENGKRLRNSLLKTRQKEDSTNE